MSESRNKEKDVVFALFQSTEAPIIMIGVPCKAWDDELKHGKTRTFDLSSVGLGVRIVLFGDKTRGHILDKLRAFNSGQPLPGEENLDEYPIPEDEKSLPKMRTAAIEFLEKQGVILEDDEAEDLITTMLNAAK